VVRCRKCPTRSIAGQLDLKLKSRPETLRVSAGYAHLFERM
jgi:hypothetical protein